MSFAPLPSPYRTHTCGEPRLSHVGQTMTLSGWVQRVRDKGSILWIDLRDRHGLMQIVLNEHTDEALKTPARALGREFVISVEGRLVERHAKNPHMPTGDVELEATAIRVLNTAKTPPFLIEAETDGSDEARLRYRYLDLRRPPLQAALLLRAQVARATRQYLDAQGFCEIETPVLIRSTPEGARDFVVPSRIHEGQYYALPQSPQTFKQLLMVAGMDRYYQIVRCFRDEDLRSDRQPEFTQIDCEVSFTDQEQILSIFEGLTREIFRQVLGQELPPLPRMTYQESMARYGNDKPDLRFGMPIHEVTALMQGHGFPPADQAAYAGALAVSGGASMTRKELDSLTEWVRRPQIGGQGLVYVRVGEGEGGHKSSVDKFYDQAALSALVAATEAKSGDMILIMTGALSPTRRALGELRLELGNRLGLRTKGEFSALWVVDFPLLEQDEETGAWHAMHHPFTSPRPKDAERLETDPGSVRANAYDLVINGYEVGGGSIRIHDRALQERMFARLGLTPEQAEREFGFLMEAFTYGAPPHGGIAFGLDRLVMILSGAESIREVMAFPKNNAGRDTMIDAPTPLEADKLAELGIRHQKAPQA